MSSEDFPSRIKRILGKDERTIKRSDGTKMKLRRISGNKKIKILGKEIFQYEYQEDVKTAPWIRERRKYMIFTEEDLFNEKRQNVIDSLLNVDRIQKRCKESGGYIGYYDEQGVIHVVPKRSKYFRVYPRNFEGIYSDFNVSSDEEIETINSASKNEYNLEIQRTDKQDIMLEERG